MTLDAVVSLGRAVRQEGRVLDVLVRLHHNGVSDDHLSVEHLEVTVGQGRPVLITVGALSCEVVGSAPHSAVCAGEVHVEAVSAFVDGRWLGTARTVVQVAHLRRRVVHVSHILDLSLESIPEDSVLNSFDLHYCGVRQGLFEFALNFLELRALVR